MPKADFQYAAVSLAEPVQLFFSEAMNLIASNGGVEFIQTHDALGRLDPPKPVVFTPQSQDVGTSTAMLITANLEHGSRYQIKGFPNKLFDLGGNKLPADQKFEIIFFTLADPNARAVYVTEDGEAWVKVDPGALGTEPYGVAFDGDVANDTAPLGSTVRRASGAVSRRSGGAYNQVLASKEFNRYRPDGTLIDDPFQGPVRLTFRYHDSDGDGIVDETANTHPVKVDKLSIHALDERSGAWMKLPGSVVDAGAQEVSVDLRHFSVYALMGTASFDLTEAHPFPVPYRASEHVGGIMFSFPNASLATVKVYTLDGRLVKTLSDDTGAGFVRWDPVANEGGDPVASDVYLYVIENDQQRKVGKLMVIR
jgi:hypothetical protein